MNEIKWKLKDKGNLARSLLSPAILQAGRVMGQILPIPASAQITCRSDKYAPMVDLPKSDTARLQDLKNNL